MVNDVTSNEEMVRADELELRGALFKFRGPGTGDSEEVNGEGLIGVDEDRWGSMVSVS